MVAFLLFESDFPRSLRYCLHSGYGLLTRIWDKPTAGMPGRGSQKRYETLLGWLDRQAETLDLAQIHTLLTAVVDEVTAICSRIAQDIQGPARDAKTTKIEAITPRVQTQTQE